MELLTTESRGEIIENRHYGTICVVGRDGIIAQSGNSEMTCYFRSSSKPIQALPLLLMGLDKKYGLSEEECAITAGSNAGEAECTAVAESLMKKAGVREDDLILGARYPSHPAAKETAIASGMAPRKLWHGCAPKHISAMLLQRELTGSINGYYLPDSAAQRFIRYIISMFTNTPYNKIVIGTDGCGIPVFGVRADKIAKAYYYLAYPEALGEPYLADAALRMTKLMNKYPTMVRGSNYLCTVLNSFSNIVAKGGASGVYTLGLKKERLGIMLKLLDGTETSWQVIVCEILKELSPKINAGAIYALETLDLNGTVRKNILNAAGEAVGKMEPMFVLK